MVKRGEIYYADLSPVVGSEQGGVRPVLVVQNNVGNRYSPTVIAAAITSQLDKAKLPTHIAVPAEVCGLPRNSVVLLEQIRTIDKKRLGEKIGELPSGMMARVNEALLVSLGFSKPDPAAPALRPAFPAAALRRDARIGASSENTSARRITGFPELRHGG